MTDYDLKAVNLPRLAGNALRLFTGLVDNPVTSPLLMSSLLESGGLTKLRRLKVDDPPTFSPLVSAAGLESGSPPDLGSIARTTSTAPTDGFAFATVADYAEAYRAGRLTPEDVARRVLEAIKDSESRTPPMRFFIAVRAEEVISQARASTQRYRDGKALSLFDGVPIAVKDEVDMVPYPTTVGTRFLGRSPARNDSTVAGRLRAAGALLIGKANMHEIGINPIGFNAHHGTPRNPYGVGHYTGGSSSGSAAAVAAGLCPVAIGADGGGSIRIPAALCGVAGLKATFGRVSEYGAFPLCWSVAHVGPLAACATDLALAYAVIAGPDPNDSNSLRQPPVTLDGFGNADLRGLTLGVYRPWFNHATAEVVSACESVLKALESAGAKIREIEIPELEAGRVAHAVTILSEMANAMEKYRAEHGREHAADVRINLAIGRACTSRDYIQAQRIRTRVMAHFANALEQVDVIASPSTAITAPPIYADAMAGGESDLGVVTEAMRFVIPGNFAGLPALSFPAGYDSKGLPIGFQVMGRHWHEHMLLRIARAAEKTVTRQAPEVHYKILDS